MKLATTEQRIERLRKLMEEPQPKGTTFSDVHKAIESIMERPVWTHEMAFPEMLYEEIRNGHVGETFGKSLQEIAKTKPVIGIVIDESHTKPNGLKPVACPRDDDRTVKP